jgi:hypothetical protein
MQLHFRGAGVKTKSNLDISTKPFKNVFVVITRREEEIRNSLGYLWRSPVTGTID